jgi:hypothetical protein
MNLSNTLRTAFQLLAITILAFPASAKAQETVDAPMKNGIIVLTAFEGDVKISTSSNDETQAPSKGAILKQGQIIVTGPKAKASLAFENGIVMEVAPSTKFLIQEFQQAPWDVAPEKLAEMKSEPSKSKTTGYLEYGDIITGVKKLKPGSSLEVSTPLGTAGIRGTDFKTSAVKNSDGTPKAFTVGVASGEVGVRSAGGGDTVPVAAGTSSTVAVTPSQSGQGGTIQAPATSQLSAEAGSNILSSVSSQRSSGQAVFAQAVVSAAQSRESASSSLTPEQQKTLEEAATNGDEAVVEAVQQLAAETPAAAAEIAAAAAELAPNAAPQIASTAALASPALAAQIAASVATVAPSSATAIATSVAQAVPAAAAAIAGAVASVAPSSAPQIAASVAAAVPEAAAQIAQSVAAAQPQQSAQVTSQIVESVAGVDAQAVGDAAQSGVQQSTNTGTSAQPPAPPSTTNTNPQIPVPSPTPNSTPSSTPTPIPTPQATPPEIRSPR